MSNEIAILSDALKRYIVTPTNAFGLGGFVFDIDGENKVELHTEITDHFLEDNSTVQDHIAIKPKKVTLKSYVGELVYRQDESTDTFVQNAVRKLTVVNQYLPQLTQMALQTKEFVNNNIDTFSFGNIKELATERTINRVSDYWSLAKNLVNSSSRQQQAYMYFKSLMEQKILVSLQTPFEFVNNMAIESVTAIQSEESKGISDFTITLKELRFAQILNVPDGQSYYVRSGAAEDVQEEYQGRSAEQAQAVDNVGTIAGQNAFYSVVSLDEMLESGAITIEDYNNIVNNTGNNPVVDLFKAGVVTNVNDQ